MQVESRLMELIAEKEQRDNRKWSYRNIHEATGLAINTIKSWHNNKATRFDASVIIALCQWLDVELSELLVIRR